MSACCESVCMTWWGLFWFFCFKFKFQEYHHTNVVYKCRYIEIQNRSNGELKTRNCKWFPKEGIHHCCCFKDGLPVVRCVELMMMRIRESIKNEYLSDRWFDKTAIHVFMNSLIKCSFKCFFERKKRIASVYCTCLFRIRMVSNDI